MPDSLPLTRKYHMNYSFRKFIFIICCFSVNCNAQEIALAEARTVNKFPALRIAAEVECRDPEYLVLKKYLQDSISVKDTMKYKTVLQTMRSKTPI
jgi:hypothetical protein